MRRMDSTLRQIKRFESAEGKMLSFLRYMVDHRDASDREIHDMIDRGLNVIRSYPDPQWPGADTDPRAQAIIAERDGYYEKRKADGYPPRPPGSPPPRFGEPGESSGG